MMRWEGREVEECGGDGWEVVVVVEDGVRAAEAEMVVVEEGHSIFTKS